MGAKTRVGRVRGNEKRGPEARQKRLGLAERREDTVKRGKGVDQGCRL